MNCKSSGVTVQVHDPMALAWTQSTNTALTLMPTRLRNPPTPWCLLSRMMNMSMSGWSPMFAALAA